MIGDRADGGGVAADGVRQVRGAVPLPVTTLLFAVFAVTLLPYTALGTMEFSTHLGWLLAAAVLWWLSRSTRQARQWGSPSAMSAARLYVVLLVVHACIGLVMVETYWDLKGLVSNLLALAFVMVLFVGTDPHFAVRVKDAFLGRLAPVATILALALAPSGLLFDDAAIGYSLVISSMLLALGTHLPRRELVLALGYAACVMVLDTGTRSNLLKIIFPLAVLCTLGPLLHFLPRAGRALGQSFVWLLVAAPVVFFGLAATDTFNVFAPDLLPDDVVIRQRSGEGVVEEVRKTDTRTFIYLEVLASAAEKGSILLGRTPARGYASAFFGVQDENGRGERLRSEVGILNIFTWFGVLGVLSYYAVFLHGLFLAAHRSRNSVCLMLAIYSAFNLAYSWVENFSAPNLPNLVIWLALGLCYSPALRTMTNTEVRDLLAGRRRRLYRLSSPTASAVTEPAGP